MGVELELGVLLAFAIVGQSTFTRFEIETPPLRKIVKWGTQALPTVLLYRLVGHWALLLPASIAVAGSCGAAGTASTRGVRLPIGATTSCGAGSGRTTRRSRSGPDRDGTKGQGTTDRDRDRDRRRITEDADQHGGSRQLNRGSVTLRGVRSFRVWAR